MNERTSKILLVVTMAIIIVGVAAGLTAIVIYW